MINEASKLGIAMNLVESKLANKTIEMRKNQDEKNALRLEKEYELITKEKNEIYAGNMEYINAIIDEQKIKKMEVENHD